MIVFNVVIGGFSGMDLKYLAHVTVRLQLLLYIVLTISILISQEASAYFVENSCDFVDKHDYSVICRLFNFSKFSAPTIAFLAF